MSKKKAKATDVVLCLLLSINTLLLLVFALQVCQWQNKRIAALEPRASRICVPSTEFHESTCPTTVTSLNDRGQCCGKVSDIIDELLSVSIKKTFDEHYPSRNLSASTDSCKRKKRQQSVFNANGFSVITVTSDKNAPLIWATPESISTNPESDFMYNNDGNVHVKETGNYFLHCQIMLFHRPPPNMASNLHANSDNQVGRSITYTLLIKHFSYKEKTEKILLKSIKHLCGKPGQNFTMSTGAVFFLEENDHVFVVTSHHNQIVQSDNDNRFSVKRFT